MNNEHNGQDIPLDEDWWNDLLGADKDSGNDLTSPDEQELERIVQETLAENWTGIETQPQPEEIRPAEQEIGSTQLFRKPEMPVIQSEPKNAVPIDDDINEEIARFVQETVNNTQSVKSVSTQDDPVAPEENDTPVNDTADEAENPVEKKKTRPKGSKGYGLFGIPHLLATAVWLAIIVAVGITLGRLGWICAADLLAFGKEPREASITITQEDDTASVAQKLKDAGLINNPWLFEQFADLTGKGDDISVGTFLFSDKIVYDYNALIKSMIDYGPATEVVEIMFPEGYNCAQIFQLLEEKGVCSVADLEEYAAKGDLKDYWFLDGLKRGHKYCLEGYLAPDTYKFYVNDDPQDVLEKFLDEFDDRITDHLRQKYLELNERLAERMRSQGYGSSYIAECQFSFHEVVILASIVEKETSDVRESYKIASVFFNRLSDPADYPYLGSDATILYATDYYNKGQLITDEQINASPYNTYTFKGLPAGPIANPGLNSLGAALDPEDTDFFYFIYDKSIKEHRFSKTLAEHEQWDKVLSENE